MVQDRLPGLPENYFGMAGNELVLKVLKEKCISADISVVSRRNMGDPGRVL